MKPQESPTNHNHPYQGKLLSVMFRRDNILPSLILLSTLLLLIPARWLFVELWQSLALQLFTSYIVFSAAAALFKKWKISLASMSCAVVCLLVIDTGAINLNANTVAEYGKTIEQLKTSGGVSGLTVAHFNVLRPNRDYKSTMLAARGSDADLISFQEVDEEWMSELKKEFGSSYPYCEYTLTEGNFGLAVFSRYPLTNVQKHLWEGVPQISGRIMMGSDAVGFIAAHTYNPIFFPGLRARNRQLKHIADYVKSEEGPVLAIGDWNSVPWSHAIRNFRASTGMTDSRRSLQCTYPGPFARMGIPIDYIFYNERMACLEFDTLGGTSSDHRGIVGLYTIHPKQKN